MFRLPDCAPYVWLAGMPGLLLGQAGPPPIPAVQSVTSLGTVVQDPVVQGRDGTFSALINGKSVWTFGDTSMTRPNASGQNFIDNSMAWTSNLDASHGIALNGNYVDSSGVPAEFLPFLPWESAYNAAHSSTGCTAQPCGAEFALWAGPIVADPARNRALIFYIEIWRVPGHSGWVTIGSSVAILQNGKVTRPVVHPGTQYPTLLWTGSQTGYVSGSLTVGDTLYSYGCTAGFLVQNCALGKVALESVTVPPDWSYYTASGTWSSDPAAAVAVFQGGAAGNTVLWNDFLGMYVAIYSGVLSNDVYYRVAYNPWGPWSDQTLIFTGLPGWENNVDYAAEAHPEFQQGNGQTQYVTYVQTTGFLAQVIQLMQVTFAPPAP